MKEKILGIYNYIIAGIFGFWSLLFMDSSACVSKSCFGGPVTTSSLNMYNFIFTNAPNDVSAAVIAASVFEIFMIIIASVLLFIGIIKILKLHGVKIGRIDKIGDCKIKGKIDIITILLGLYILFDILAIICIAVFASKISSVINPLNYFKARVGFAPIWLLISGLAAILLIIFKDKIIALLSKKEISATASSCCCGENCCGNTPEIESAKPSVKKSQSKPKNAKAPIAIKAEEQTEKEKAVEMAAAEQPKAESKKAVEEKVSEPESKAESIPTALPKPKTAKPKSTKPSVAIIKEETKV